jgi:hypothetical protein
MTRTSPHFIWGAGCVAALLFGANARAQMPGADSASGINAALPKLFGKVSAFTAQVEVQVLDKSQAEIMNTPMEFSMLDKKIRVAVDMAQMRNKNMPPGTATTLRQMGMAQVTSVIRPDKKLIYIIYPDEKCFLTMPLPAENSGAEDKEPKIRKTALGKETIDDHPCEKNKVVLTDEKGQSLEATTWNATDLKDFPIQIQSTEKEHTSVMHFRQIKLEKPDAALFEPPADYQQYKDQQELLMAIMKKGASTEAPK